MPTTDTHGPLRMFATGLLKCADPFTNFVTYALGVCFRKIDEQARLFVLSKLV